jgi:biopolymer transport protein ExbB
MLDLITRGGPLMWPLLACSVVSLAVIIERLLFWVRLMVRRDRELVNRIFTLTEAGQFEAAVEAAAGTACVTSRILGSGLAHRKYGLTNCLEAAAGAEIEHMRRGLGILDTIITLAPLLGILGTVSGIIASFDLLGQMGIQDPKAVTGGIAQALITTAAGLTIAIVTLLPYNAFLHKVEKFTKYIEKLCTHFEVTVQKGLEKRCD